jgi:hypothetical protein
MTSGAQLTCISMSYDLAVFDVNVAPRDRKAGGQRL